MKQLLIAALLLTGTLNTTTAQIKTKPLAAGMIPPVIKYSGKLTKAMQFTDESGTYVTFTTETGITNSKEDDMGKAALYAYCYKVTGNTTVPVWQVKDFVDECPVDIKAKFVPGSFAVTDLDKNGIAEVWMLYQTACRGDISPDNMKLIMYEGGKKHAMRGTTKVEISPKNFYGGKYTMDPAFKKSAPAFKRYAIALWNKNVKQKWE
ncbi:M949_RS01915 family surface polysaccharide biosynthesis protein [Mucilaginibacter aquatilis]|uniref:Uncharacterized protein n=1 Tax=Mucilaginibacter aquatilis TaxID=1517760 RepID=A0A6I4I8W0_9SPHI|nr:hypothetical protein [Mucilaginibacter aquatilis]MVN89899.1 hypothetical protein [Mucilaginibacter aquatilis]